MLVKHLIEEVRQHTCLFDIKSPDYRRVDFKDRIWANIAKKLNLDVPICKSKWKSLRDRYRKELSKLDLPSGSEVLLGKSWEYMDQLSFLKSFHTCRRSLNNPLPDIKENDKFRQQCIEISIKQEPDPDPLGLPELTSPPSTPVDTLPSKTQASILLPRLSSSSSDDTAIQTLPKRISRDNPRTARETLEKNLSKFISDGSKSLQKMGSMEHFMLSIAADVEKFGWSTKKTLKYKSKISQLTLEIDAEDSD